MNVDAVNVKKAPLKMDTTPLLLAAVASFLLHAVLLVGWPSRLSGSSKSLNPQSMQVRVMSADRAKPLDTLSPNLSISPVENQKSPAMSPVGTATQTPSAAQSGQSGQGSLAPLSKMDDLGRKAMPLNEGSSNDAQKSAPVPATAGLPPAPSYHVAGELDPPPRPLEEIEPGYPEAAGSRDGSVIIRILIGAEGNVDDVAVVRSFPKGFFEESAISAFSQAKFSPGMIKGHPVKSQITIEVQYTPVNRGSAVSGNR